ncbi:sensor domain-containing diguanylate cyclase [Desulfogranum japonicum]|uniref:sensor domain-containing diguanylate cyclase n=1 Tax=Desulfogranum japonicum TaxID=231447 RepID=UPI00040C4830|nr:cache domain-containing protein [Desulfogranum japonicum]
MQLFNESNLKIAVFICLIAIVGLLSLSFLALYSFDKYGDIQEELDSFQAQYISQQTLLLRSLVDLQVQYIDTHRQQIEQNQRHVLQTRILEAKAIANNLLRANAVRYNKQRIKKIILDTLRPIRFNNGRGYYFIYDADERLVLYPPAPEKEGLYISQAFPEVQSAPHPILQFAEKKDSRFVRYDWLDPATRKVGPKISYLTKLPKLNWVIGSGIYLDELVDQAQHQVIGDLKQGAHKESTDYFFVYQVNDIHGGDTFAKILVHPARPESENQHLLDEYTDIHGRPFRKAFLQDIRKQGDALISYWYPQKGQTTPQKKLSYFKLYPKWNWIVARGVYLDDMEELLTAKKELFIQEIKKKTLLFSFLFCVFFLLVTGVAFMLTKTISGLIEGYKEIQARQNDKLRQVNKNLQKQATTDRLTGIANRRHFNQQLTKEFYRTKRYGSNLSLILFDIDNVKQGDDILAPLKGDQVLRPLARLVACNTRKSDLVVRWGRVKFALLLSETDQDQARQIAEKLRRKISDYTFSIQKQITCSFGVTQYQLTDQSGDFINRCDQALYDAKKAGRNVVCSR